MLIVLLPNNSIELFVDGSGSIKAPSSLSVLRLLRYNHTQRHVNKSNEAQPRIDPIIIPELILSEQDKDLLWLPFAEDGGLEAGRVDVVNVVVAGVVEYIVEEVANGVLEGLLEGVMEVVVVS